MNADAYAGFLKLWLTPAGKVPRPSAELDAYLRYANAQDPLPESVRSLLRSPTKQAA